ncbi:uncharacterized protein BP5553_03407 [Venustampulla echinocandica]|uniref:Uncharacterized protein n=1 Tax=Venustampulla echinocandica TaxID=2656787 RepID=A0A370TU57_9HELO|nr:uncharacterized protein BP5553_03407 [Venustampulla echinocandica]RDL39067.1 hypothetical protein BP5553_03407 [Venustampulla echinocandica]
MPPTENRPPRVALRPQLATKLPRVTLCSPKPKPLDGTKSTGNIARTTPQNVGSWAKLSEVAAVHPRPVKTRVPVSLLSTPKFKRDEPPVCNDTDADDEESDDLNEITRSALIFPNTPRKAQTPGSNKSVRWDPAIISCGPITSGQSTPSVRLRPVSPSPKRQSSNLTRAVKTFLHLKKDEHEELLKLLQSLKLDDVEDRYTGKPSRRQTRSEPTPGPRFNDAKKLNPEAPAFRDFSGMKRRISHSKIPLGRDFHSLDTPQRRTQVPVAEITTQKDPAWLDIFTPPVSDNSSNDALSRQAIHRDVRIHDSSTPRPNFPQPIFVPIPVVETPYGFQISHQQPIWFNTLGFQPRPLLTPQSPPIFHRLPIRARRIKGPLVDVSPQFIPPEEGSGRTAHANTIDESWGQYLLDKFTAKYPKTGKMKGPTSAPGKMRQAAAIQQQLEFLLYQEKEKSVFEDRAGNLQRRNVKRCSGSGMSSKNSDAPATPQHLKISGIEICSSIRQVLEGISPPVVVG